MHICCQYLAIGGRYFLTMEERERKGRNLDPRLKGFAANGLALPEIEKVALAAFLLTLTDHELLTDPRYSDPQLQPGGRGRWWPGRLLQTQSTLFNHILNC